MGAGKRSKRVAGGFAAMLESLKKESEGRVMAPLFADLVGGSVTDGEASRQVDAARSLEGARAVFVFPDIHPGKGIPIGVSLVTQGGFYPHVAGSDLGCGVLLCRLVPGRRPDFERLSKREWLADGIDGESKSELADFLAANPGLASEWGGIAGFGTLGGGNHFAEIGVVSGALSGSPLSDGELSLMVHTGSRSMGDAIGWRWGSEGGGSKAVEDSGPGVWWLEAQAFATEWARLNRMACARSIAGSMGALLEPVADVWHNGIERVVPDGWPEWADPSLGPLFVHRKGAGVASGLVPLPSSRGEDSFLMEALDADLGSWGMSMAHGAGRRWRRGECRERLSGRFTLDDLTRGASGGFVHCRDQDLLWEEAPQAYRSGAACAGAMEGAGLARRICSLSPRLTIKA